jgi:hypothetical protein
VIFLPVVMDNEEFVFPVSEIFFSDPHKVWSQKQWKKTVGCILHKQNMIFPHYFSTYVN